MRLIPVGLMVGALMLLPVPVLAEYVLPYPSFMPGNTMYRITRLTDRLKAIWHFGNLSSYRYRLALADKYLVEAKTLFEYRQYLLASDALERSDEQFSAVPGYLINASKEGKDTRQFLRVFAEASAAHKNVLAGLLANTPDTFVWSPEKSAATTLPIREMLLRSVRIRDAAMQRLGGGK